jgi:polar amino acid transport system substrate-binding protein
MVCVGNRNFDIVFIFSQTTIRTLNLIATTLDGWWFHNHRRAWQPGENRMERTMKSKSIIPNPYFLAGVAGLVLAGVVGCATTRHNPLRVGVTPDYPPLVFEQDGGVVGAEIDLANALGAQLNRPVKCYSMRWDQLIPTLQEGRIDIIMSGMSVTRPRQLRIAFSEPYLHNQLRAIFSRPNADRFKTREDVLNTTAKIGVVPGTTADVFVQENCPKAERVNIGTRRDAAFHLLQDRRIDLFVDDSFALAQILSENEADLTYLAQPLAGDDLAWGIRSDNQELLRQVNVVLDRWKSEGTLDRILLVWMPYLHKYESLQQGGSTGGNVP